MCSRKVQERGYLPAYAGQPCPQREEQGKNGKRNEREKADLDFHEEDYRYLYRFPLCAWSNRNQLEM